MANFCVKKFMKVVFVGDMGVGKTTMIACIAKTSRDNLEPTVMPALTKVVIDGVTLKVWDTAGQEQYRGLTACHFQGAHVVVVVCDGTHEDANEELQEWINTVKNFFGAGQEPKRFVVVSKKDMEQEAPIDDIRRMAKEWEAEVFMVSGKTGEGVDLLFKAIAGLDIVVNEETSVCLEGPRGGGSTKSGASCC